MKSIAFKFPAYRGALCPRAMKVYRFPFRQVALARGNRMVPRHRLRDFFFFLSFFFLPWGESDPEICCIQSKLSSTLSTFPLKFIVHRIRNARLHPAKARISLALHECFAEFLQIVPSYNLDTFACRGMRECPGYDLLCAIWSLRPTP